MNVLALCQNVKQFDLVNIQNKKQMSYKIVQNYQLTESNSYIQDGSNIQTYIAQHNVTKLPYLLKKVNTKESSDRVKYQSLLNQIGILKVLASPQVIQCHKMLKTPNNIYLVYDYCDGSPLSQIIKNSTKQLKISIIIQLLDVLKLMASSSIVHCNLKPSCIVVSVDKKIKVMNFTNGQNREGKKTIPVKFKPTPSNYVAPQILKQGIVHQKSDFYSLGIILNQMNLITQGNYLGVENNINISKLTKIIQSLTSEDPNQRPDLQQIINTFKPQKQNSPRKKSTEVDSKTLFSPSSSLKRTNSDNSEAGKKILSPNQENIKINQKKFVEQILKRRNLAIFLLQMSQTCLKIQDQEKRLSIFLSYIFMKKSCKVICGLLSFLKNQKNSQNYIQGLNFDKNQRTNFQKKPDFFKIVSTIQKQASNQKRWLQDIYKNISPELPNKLKQLSSLDDIDQKAFFSYILQFLTYIVKESSLVDSLTNKITQNLYLMSEIIPHKSYQKMFQEMITQQKISLDQQYLYIHVRKMEKKELISQISGRIKVK